MKKNLLTFVILISALPAFGQAAPLSLKQAVAIALEKNPARKIALADQAASRAGVEQARSMYFPRIGFTETLTLGNDPVYAFGTRLRQARFTQEDFALNRLNTPDPIGNYSSRVGGSWKLFDSFQRSLEFKSAKANSEAAQHQLNRTDQEVIYRVVQAYYGVLLAKRQLEVAEQTLHTAQALLDSAMSKVDAGIAVDADALSAKVMYATRQQEVIRAKGNVDIAQTRLELALGVRLNAENQPPDALSEMTLPAVDASEAEDRAFRNRPDLKAVAAQVSAHETLAKAAKASFGPSLDVFGSWQADNLSFASGGSSNWMTGAELRIDVFAREKSARLALEKANLARVQATAQLASDNARLEVRSAFVDADSARQMLEVARGAMAQADESLRIIRDRYDTGLVPITELLRAEDVARSSRTSYWESVFRHTISYAALQLATGDLTDNSVVVTQ